jgi:hypothetical protein
MRTWRDRTTKHRDPLAELSAPYRSLYPVLSEDERRGRGVRLRRDGNGVVRLSAQASLARTVRSG